MPQSSYSDKKAFAIFLRRAERVSDVVSLFIFVGLFVSLLPLEILSNHPATGGDMGSHYWPFKILVEKSLPNFSIRSWNPGNLAGEPHFLLYFPVPFLFMSLLASVLSTAMAFNFGTLLAAVLFPFSIYFCLRAMGHKFPAPIIAAGFSLLMLYNEGNSMWGGNFLSLLAGQFAHIYALVFFALAIGVFASEIRKNKKPYLSSFLFAAVVCSHAYVALAIPLVCISFIFFYRHQTLLKRVLHTFYSGLLCSLLSLWFVLPLIQTAKWTTPFAFVWKTDSFWKEFVPPMVWAIPFSIAACLLVALTQRFFFIKRKTVFLTSLFRSYWFWGLFSFFLSILYVIFPKVGLVDIRTLPQIQFAGVILAGVCLGSFLRKDRILAWIFVIPFSLSCVFLVQGGFGFAGAKNVTSWLQWNYSGWVTKKPYKDLQDLSSEIKGDLSQPRVVYEHGVKNNLTGTIRVFEMLPYFANRATLESVYMQASILSPMAFHIQALVSMTPSCPFLEFACPKMSLRTSKDKLELMGVQDLILHSKSVLAQADNVDWLTKKGEFGFWNLFSLQQKVSLVEVLQKKPKIIKAKNWKKDFLYWFEKYTSDSTYLVKEDDHLNESSFSELSLDPNRECEASVEANTLGLKLITSCPGKAHILKFSYHSAWRASGDEQLYLVSPGFIILFPENNETKLSFGSQVSWRMASFISFATFLMLAFRGVFVSRKYFNIPFFKSLFFISSFILMSVVDSYAGTLTIDGTGSFTTRVDADNLEFSGEYTIQNSGDEVAHSVFPKFALGQWAWAGEEVNINPDSKNTWTFNLKIPFKQLSCNEAQICFKEKVPLSGVHPISIARHYSDANGYPFSSVNAVSLQIGELSNTAQAEFRSPPFLIKTSVENKGDKFSVISEFFNNSNKKLTLTLSLLLPKELISTEEPSVLVLEPLEKKRFTLYLENFSGLVGSVYSASVIAKWSSNGIPLVYVHSFHIPLKAQVSSSIGYLIPISVVVSLIFLFFGLRRLKG